MKRFVFFGLIVIVLALILRNNQGFSELEETKIIYSGGRKECQFLIDLETGLYVQFFPSRDIRLIGYVDLESLSIDTLDSIFGTKYMKPLGYWYRFNSNGELLSKCENSDVRVVGYDTCHMDVLTTYFWTMDFVPVHCEEHQ